MLDQQRLREAEARCTQELPPRCQAACPLKLDVRLFLQHMHGGAWNEARKVLERHIPLAGIICRVCDHPCEDACLRRELGGGLAVGELERACLEWSAAPRPLPRARKITSLTVLGAGLAGLVAAREIARKGHTVKLWHAGTVGDVLAQAFPALTAAQRDAELEMLAKDVTFCEGMLDAALLATVSAEAEAVFVDAAAVHGLTPERSAVDAETLLWRDNICCGGWLERSPTGHAFASASRQAGDGRRAALTLERVMGGLSLTAARVDADTDKRLHTDLEGIAPQPRLIPQGGMFTEEDARSEAARCMQCQCLICVKACAYMRRHGSYPRQYARQIHNNASIVKGHHLANSLINGCTLCGQCTELCPEGFSMAELCLAARQDMVRRDYMPPSAHAFALEDMDSAVGAHAVFHLEGRPAFAFFPGCQLWAARGPQVLAAWRWLQELPLAADGRTGVGLILSCCGIPAHWAGRQERFTDLLQDFRTRWEAAGAPRIITGCASCHKLFTEFLPETRPLSLWEALDAHPVPKSRGGAAQTLSVHDPCTARHNEAWQKAVRSLAGKCGVTVHEPRHTGTQTACCGYGGLAWNAQPDVARDISMALAEELPHTALASCVMCRDRLVAQDKACLHLLDVLPLDAESVPPLEKAPGLSARRAHRAALRRSLGGDVASRTTAGIRLRMADTVLEAMENRYILREDAEEAVAGVEATGNRFQETESGHFVGAWRPRHVTFWVRYSVEDDGFVLHDAWCHRMVLPGAGDMTPLKKMGGEGAS